MALKFDDNVTGERLTINAAASINNLAASTMITWIRMDTEGSLFPRLFDKVQLVIFRDTSNARLNGQRGRATTQAGAIAAYTSFTHWGLSKWMSVAWSYDSTTDANNRLLVGDLTHLPEEPSAYTQQQAGSGSLTDDSGDNLIIGNRNSPTDRAADARIGFFGLWDRAMSVAEIQSQAFRPRVSSGSVIFMQLGYQGTGTQVDWSGNGNNGTVTAATVEEHAPLPFRRGRPLYAPYTPAAAPATNPYGVLSDLKRRMRPRAFAPSRPR